MSRARETRYGSGIFSLGISWLWGGGRNYVRKPSYDEARTLRREANTVFTFSQERRLYNDEHGPMRWRRGISAIDGESYGIFPGLVERNRGRRRREEY